MAAVVDDAKLEAFMGQAVTDMGAIISAPLFLIGEKLGLYKAMAGAGPLSSQEVAERAGVAERNVREWLRNQAAGGYVSYDAESDRYTLPDEQALALADEDSPFYILGVYDLIASLYADEDEISRRSAVARGWVGTSTTTGCSVEQSASSARATVRISWPSGYRRLTASRTSWSRAQRSPMSVAAMAPRRSLWPKHSPIHVFRASTTTMPSIDRARHAAGDAGVSDRVVFEAATAKEFPGSDYDLVCVFDCLHDMGDPVGASAHVRETLAPDGSWMIVEPFANDRVEDNFNPVGRVFYGASTVICTPASLSQEVGLALGAQAGEERLREVLAQGGFSRVRRAAETPFNMILEARP